MSIVTRIGDPLLNRLVHEPARLAILAALSACDKADFVFLRKQAGESATAADRRA